ncbi:MAG: D,D-heptose 1,7-bisphosphate phosphatase [Planctomycetes bacterium]|nr:D,D-heptose 1,7-bisphosphate phosphatase [Planctomycetota bacterium]MBV21789.1 D,D-heptose 1,7-bisphosphate phosphatase [Planctomycetaceae bacterium]HJM56943.1 HAD family hydrolase [Planctomycetota bacterium]
MNRAVFLDRDGTLNREVNYLADPAQLELLPGVAEGLSRLAREQWLLCVVTNQSGVARGLVSEEALAEIHGRLREMLASEGAHLDWIGHCPHHPEHGPPDLRRACDCRKPEPGLLLRAAAELDIDLTRSWMVGDSARDLEAGRSAGCRSILVGTGNGAAPPEASEADGQESGLKAPDFLEAVDLILKDPAPPGRS